MGLVQAIEKLTGVTLEEYPLEEEEVLKGITKVRLIPFRSSVPHLFLPPEQMLMDGIFTHSFFSHCIGGVCGAMTYDRCLKRGEQLS